MGWGCLCVCVCVCPSVELACHCSVRFTPPSLSSVGFLFSVAVRVCSFLFFSQPLQGGEVSLTVYGMSFLLKNHSDAAVLLIFTRRAIFGNVGTVQTSLQSLSPACICTFE